MARIVSINVSPKKGTFKHPVESAEFRVNFGIVGDAHAGDWHRQVSLLGQESIDKMTAMGVDGLKPGMFAENITTEGIELYTLPVGTRLRLGGCLAEVTQIGKQCHNDCEIFRKVGKCVMPHEGIFVRILQGGTLRAGDPIAVEPARA